MTILPVIRFFKPEFFEQERHGFRDRVQEDKAVDSFEYNQFIIRMSGFKEHEKLK